MTLKERIKIAYGTQEAFAEATGVNLRTIRRWVNEDKIPGGMKAFDAKNKLAKAYKKALDESF